MQPPHIITGQSINPTKLERAKHLRKNMTPAEKLLWQHLRANRLDGLHFRRQQVISGFIVDFYCHPARLIVEVDGEIHQQQQEYDRERDCFLISQGIQILRVTNEQVIQNLQDVLERIVEACKMN
jgi:very-short-patch-repair endonuclease